MADYTDAQINALQGFIADAESALKAGDSRNAVNDVNLYYNFQSDMRGYASDALQVVNDIGVFGVVANQEIIDAVGQQAYSARLPEIVVDLASADLATIVAQGDIPTENEIADYHHDVYASLDIDPEFWGGSSGAALGLDWAQGTLNAVEQDPDLTSNKFYQSFNEDQTRTSIANLEIAGFKALASEPLTAANLAANISGSVYLCNLQNAFNVKYGHLNLEFGSNTVTHQTSTFADASGGSLTAELDTDTSNGNVAYSAVFTATAADGHTVYSLAGPNAQASLDAQGVVIDAGSTGTIIGSNNLIKLASDPNVPASGQNRGAVITSGESNVILGGSRRLADQHGNRPEQRRVPALCCRTNE